MATQLVSLNLEEKRYSNPAITFLFYLTNIIYVISSRYANRCFLFVGNSVERGPAGLGHVANVLPWTVQAARSQPFQRAEGLGVSAHVHSHHPSADWEQRYLVDITRGKWLLDTSCNDPPVCTRVCKAYPPSFTATVYQNHPTSVTLMYADYTTVISSQSWHTWSN